MNFISRWLRSGDRSFPEVTPVRFLDVAPAEVQDKEVQAEIESVKLDFIGEMIDLAMNSAKARQLIADDALRNINRMGRARSYAKSSV